ncbi:hypothetical protein BDP81DRAFT_436229 [Colletotrichum phormii]|uniref:Uncharacterized protein n=1 Tax=Colletotrichum phormii TaxID=359342 RepID=A0AAI9ZJ28_9PEZI|nr:uncharacterized protein BDP81DRAFT_436229 [Colletotrichum phormii]KAK1625138.1 hypothetical protein BDP81DRAFT_436229 [Colletotrichum phormii]
MPPSSFSPFLHSESHHPTSVSWGTVHRLSMRRNPGQERKPKRKALSMDPLGRHHWAASLVGSGRPGSPSHRYASSHHSFHCGLQ